MRIFIYALLLAISPWCAADEKHVFAMEVVQENSVAWSCEGQGAPTIVLMAGLGLDAHASFDLIYHRYQGKGTICMYDRPGMGHSAFKEKRVRKLDELVEELHQLKLKRNWQDLVLVPHSFAGFVARGYVSKYPKDVKGVIFLDVTHEDWMPALQAKMSVSDFAIMDRVIRWSAATFFEDYLEAQESTRNFAYPAGLSTTVISRGVPTTKLRRNQMSYEGIDIFNAEHNRLQTRLLSLSTHARHVVAQYAAHEINNYDPWLVIDEIARMVDGLALPR